MDILKSIFGKEAPATPLALPTGTFTIDRTGRVVTSTLPQHFPEKMAPAIGAAVLEVFRRAQRAEVVLNEVTFYFASVKLTARELRGGAIVFLAPRDSGGNL